MAADEGAQTGLAVPDDLADAIFHAIATPQVFATEAVLRAASSNEGGAA